MPYLAKILIYPIKSLDGIAVNQATLIAGGALAHDREFALFDAQGQFVHAKRTEKIHGIRSSFDLAARTVRLWVQGGVDQAFHLDGDRPALNAWFSDYFGYSVSLQQNLHMGFPDDTNASGPTVVSTATLAAVASWFPEVSVDEIRQRFRANLELDDVPAFWEDQLFAASEQGTPFQIGEVKLLGNNPCQRCIVPTRHPSTGDKFPNFQKHFSTQRSKTLPDWTPPSQFNHFYKLTVNTKVTPSESGKTLQINDELKLTSR